MNLHSIRATNKYNIRVLQNIRSSERFLSSYEEIIDAQRFLDLYYFAELRTIHFIPLR